MYTRFLAAFQIDDGKVYDVGFNPFSTSIHNEPASHFAAQVCDSGRPRGKGNQDLVYMFLSIDDQLKMYTFRQNPGQAFQRSSVRELKETNFFEGTSKEGIALEAANNIHNLIKHSVEQLLTLSKLMGATAGTILIKEKANA